MRIYWIVLAVFVLSCQKNEVIVGKILVDRAEGADVGFPDRSELKDWIKEGLASSGKFRFKENARGGGVLRVRLGASISTSETNPGRLFLSTQLIQDDLAEPQKWQAEIVVDLNSRKPRPALDKALKQNLESIFFDFSGAKAVGQDAVKKIQDYVNGRAMSEGEVAAAIRKLSEQKEESAAPFLVKMLKGRNMRLSVQALHALAAIGATDSIDAITDFAERKAPELRRHAIEAARRIGGSKAAAWLFTISTGHHDEQVRESARLALLDVERRLKKTRLLVSADAKEAMAKN